MVTTTENKYFPVQGTTRHGNILYQDIERERERDRKEDFGFLVVGSTYFVSLRGFSQGKATSGPSLVLNHPSYLGPHVSLFRNSVCDAVVLQGTCCGRLLSYHIPPPRASGLLLWLRSSFCYPLGIPLHLGCWTVPIQKAATNYMSLLCTRQNKIKSMQRNSKVTVRE